MLNKVNYIQAINFIKIFHTRRDKGNPKNKVESRKIGFSSVRCILMAEFY